MQGERKVANMIKVASLTRKGFIAGDISTVMSKNCNFWCQNTKFLKILVMHLE